MFFLAGIFSTLMLSSLIVMIDSNNDGRFEDKEDVEDDGLDARET